MAIAKINALTGGSSLDFLTKSMNNYFLLLHDQCKMGVCKVPSSTELVCSRKGPIGLGGGFWPFLTHTKSVHEVLEGTLQNSQCTAAGRARGVDYCMKK